MADAIEFQLGQHAYRAKRFDVFTAFKISARVVPVVPSLLPLMSAALERFKKGATPEQRVGALLAWVVQPDGLSELLQPFTDAIGNLGDDKLDYLLKTALGAIERDVGGGNWVHVWNKQAQRFQFEEFNDLGLALPAAVKVIRENLGPFISGWLASIPAAPETPKQSGGE